MYTRREVVDVMLDLAGYTSDQPLHRRRLLEPSFGGGDFLRPAVARLLAAFVADGGTPSRVRELRPAIRAVEIHEASFAGTRTALLAELRAWGARPADAAAVCDAWLIRGDFLLTELPDAFDVVVGNPPYVRQERIPGPALAEYRRRYATIYDRADLYVPFFERGLQLLGADGRQVFICANRWFKNKYGGPLRGLIARDFALTHYIDMDGADAFHAAVLAYAAITVIRRGSSGVTRIVRRPALDAASLAHMVAALLGDASTDPRVEEVEQAVRGSEPWLLDVADRLRLIRRLERQLPELEEAGCAVGIGVASGADRIYIDDYKNLPVEPTRKLPLLMAADLQDGEIRWSGQGIVNPFEPDGSLAPLDRYRRFGAYIQANRTALATRHVARRSGANWYRTIDRIDPALTGTPKLLIPDIKGAPMVVHDLGRFYPHHNLYHVTSQSWDLRALATVLRSSVAVLFVAAYCVKMAGGFLRFQAQYLRRIRVPRWDDVTPAQREALRAAEPTDPVAIDRAAFGLYGLTEAEAEVVRRAAVEARPARRAPAALKTVSRTR